MICEQPLVADKSDSRGVVTLTLNRPETSNALSRIGISNGLCKAKRASRVPEGSVLVWCWLVRAPMWTGRRAPRTLCAAQCGCRLRERLWRRPPAERPRPAVNDRSTNHRNLYLLPHVSTPRSRPDPLLLLIGAVLLLGAVLVNELLVWPALATSNELAHRGLQTEAVVVTLWRKIDQRLPVQVNNAVEAGRYERPLGNRRTARASWFAAYSFTTGAGETINANSVYVGSYTIPDSHRDSFGRDEAGAALYQRLAPGSPLAVTYLAESPSIHRPSANLVSSVLRTAFRRSVRRPG